MVVLFILESWGNGGTETYVDRLGRALADKGHDVSLALLGGIAPDLGWCSKVEVCFSSGIKKYTNLTRLVNTLQPDVTHCHLYASIFPAMLALKLQTKVPVVATWHLPLHVWNIRHLVGQKFATRMADSVIGASELTNDELLKSGVKSIALSPPIHMEKDLCSELEKSKITKTQELQGFFRVLGCGRLAAQKDWATLVRALQVMREKRPSLLFYCLILGEGELRLEIEALISSLGLNDSIEIHGHVDSGDVPSFLASADVSVLPSKFEGFGMSAVEAMALGIPTITSDFPASHEFLHDPETGSHFPIGDVEALAEKLIWHAEHPDESAAMGVRGKKFVASRYSPEVIAKKHVAVYQTLCDS